MQKTAAASGSCGSDAGCVLVPDGAGLDLFHVEHLVRLNATHLLREFFRFFARAEQTAVVQLARAKSIATPDDAVPMFSTYTQIPLDGFWSGPILLVPSAFVCHTGTPAVLLHAATC